MSHHTLSKLSYSIGKGLVYGALPLLSIAPALIPSPARAEGGWYGEVKTFAQLPAEPGYPEGIAVHGNRVFVSGAATFGTAGKGPSKIFVYDRDSKVHKTTIVVMGERLDEEHALSSIAVDGKGRVYALSTQLGLIRFTKVGPWYVQERYGRPLPDLPACVDVSPGTACSPTPFDMPPLPNDIVFDEAGNVYVSDSFQATVWRYCPGGGRPKIWFQSAALSGEVTQPFGANGLRLDPQRENVYVSVTFSLQDPGLGYIYRIPLVDDPDEADLEQVHRYEEGAAPDGFAFGSSGKLYVTLAGANAISVLDEDGNETTRIHSPPGASIPLDAPANVAFNDAAKTLLIVNHALFSGEPDHFAVLRVWVGDTADPLEKPWLR
ncbi:hypothetical protein SOCEGT47_050590 [Sorangium cellulosum]|uniref:SMP-30/Gluconolactonase/LRE-like region domain-containing protein n=1 Tax=Sorangium cellulosum TaxID=56 RepID=A0A4P2Q5M1_SORCE|nr:hypothetical protein SOCEGT47_050590 [Sorangium cellulosum]